MFSIGRRKASSLFCTARESRDGRTSFIQISRKSRPRSSACRCRKPRRLPCGFFGITFAPPPVMRSSIRGADCAGRKRHRGKPLTDDQSIFAADYAVTAEGKRQFLPRLYPLNPQALPQLRDAGRVILPAPEFPRGPAGGVWDPLTFPNRECLRVACAGFRFPAFSRWPLTRPWPRLPCPRTDRFAKSC